jgi:hypothetical protein
MADNLPYDYAKLPSSTDHIRLLVSDRQQYDEVPLRTELRFTFRTASVDVCPDFIALSYEWGSPDDNDGILIDGQIVAIRRNLASALTQIRQLKVVLKGKAVCAPTSLYLTTSRLELTMVRTFRTSTYG